MSWVATAVVATVVGAQVYSADQQRKATNKQTSAIKDQAEADARAAAEAETSAAVAANTELANRKARRRNSALGLGDTSATLGGGAGVPSLGAARYATAGRAAQSATVAAAALPAASPVGGGSALGMGAGGGGMRGGSNRQRQVV